MQYPIQETRIEFRVAEDLPWTVQDTVPADATQELLFEDAPAGTMYYRATVIDNTGQEGTPAETQTAVAGEPPGMVTNFTATVE